MGGVKERKFGDYRRLKDEGVFVSREP